MERLAPELLAEQASQPGGLLRIRLEGDHVVLIGHAVTAAMGTCTSDSHTGTPDGVNRLGDCIGERADFVLIDAGDGDP